MSKTGIARIFVFEVTITTKNGIELSFNVSAHNDRAAREKAVDAFVQLQKENPPEVGSLTAEDILYCEITMDTELDG